MKALVIVLAAAAFFASCTLSPKQTTTQDTLNAKASLKSDSIPGPACYLLLEGTANQDSTRLRLQFSGSDVTGELNWIPAEKDSRTGKITGTRTGNSVKGTWTFMQEGMQDTLSVEFQLAGKILYQRAYKTDPATGRQQLRENGPLDKQFSRIACP